MPVMQRGQISIRDTSMYYFSFGSGTKPLVMLPGLTTRRLKGTEPALAYMYRIFGKEFKVYFFDRVDTVKDDYSICDMADDTALAMAALNIDHASVVGVSQGGMIAQMLALNYPDLVDKLVLAVTLSRPNETLSRVINRWIDHAERGDYISLNKESITLLYSDAYLKKNKMLLPIAVRASKPEDLSRFTVLARACLTFDAYDDLYRIKCPVLVLGGKKDKVVTGRASEEIAERLNCEIYMYDDYGHAAYDEAKDFNFRIYDFLSE